MIRQSIHFIMNGALANQSMRLIHLRKEIGRGLSFSSGHLPPPFLLIAHSGLEKVERRRVEVWRRADW